MNIPHKYPSASNRHKISVAVARLPPGDRAVGGFSGRQRYDCVMADPSNRPTIASAADVLAELQVANGRLFDLTRRPASPLLTRPVRTIASGVILGVLVAALLLVGIAAMVAGLGEYLRHQGNQSAPLLRSSK